MKDIIKDIESLPPLSKTLINIITFSQKKDKTNEELISLIKDDSLLISSLLKISNSALFGFKNKVTNIQNLVNLLGVNFTVSLILSNSLEKSFNIDFSPYGINQEEFQNRTCLAINFLNLWLSKIDINLKNNLLLPVILVDIGKHLLSTKIINQNKKNDFLSKIQKDLECLTSLEKKFCSISSLEITIKLLKYWNIDKNIINNIKHIDKIEISPKNYEKSAKILDVVKTICNISTPLSENSIKRGLEKAKEYDFDIEILNDIVSKMKERISIEN